MTEEERQARAEADARHDKVLADNKAECERIAKRYADALASGELKRSEYRRDTYYDPVSYGSYPGMARGDADGE
jgi:hypothetical protein